MHKFEILQERLQAEGWYVGWGLACCQSCAWGDLPFEHETGPFKGQDLDFDKVLFNHEQDCENDDCEYDEDLDEYLDKSGNAIDKSTYCSVPYVSYEEQNGSMFCYSGDKKGVANLIEILPIIEECGCNYSWSKKGSERIYISWE